MNSDIDKIEKLRSELHYHNYLYYNLNKPIISDFEFDNKLKTLIELEKKNPIFFDNNSPSQRVGGSISDSFKTIVHKEPMYSLSNTYNKEEVFKWEERLIKILGDKNYELNLNAVPPISIVLVGLQGSGKTTTTAKLAKYLQSNHKKTIMRTIFPF